VAELVDASPIFGRVVLGRKSHANPYTGSSPVLTTNIGGEAINKSHAEYSRLYLHESFPGKKFKKSFKKIRIPKEKCLSLSIRKKVIK
jgi:hypothetical protein